MILALDLEDPGLGAGGRRVYIARRSVITRLGGHRLDTDIIGPWTRRSTVAVSRSSNTANS
ncbi:MAG: hypothetical protein R3D30_08290 [Hyphomicrobiales bacterium]